MLISTTNNNKLNNKQLKEKNKMNQDQITALAREYAEEIYPHEEGEDLGQMSFLRNNAIKHISSTLKMLLRHYALVEKSKINEQYTKYMQQFCDTRDIAAKEYAGGWISALESLFPEIAKEVEG